MSKVGEGGSATSRVGYEQVALKVLFENQQTEAPSPHTSMHLHTTVYIPTLLQQDLPHICHEPAFPPAGSSQMTVRHVQPISVRV